MAMPFARRSRVLWHWIVLGLAPGLPFVLKTAKGRVTDQDCLRTCVPPRRDLAILPSHLPRLKRFAEAGNETYNPEVVTFQDSARPLDCFAPLAMTGDPANSAAATAGSPSPRDRFSRQETGPARARRR